VHSHIEIRYMIQYLADDNVMNSNAVERPVHVWVYELNSLYFPL